MRGKLFSRGAMGWVTKGLISDQDSDIGKFTRIVTKNILERAQLWPLTSN